MALNPGEYTLTVLDYAEPTEYGSGRALVFVEPPIETGQNNGGHDQALRKAGEGTLVLYGLPSPLQDSLRSVTAKPTPTEFVEGAVLDENAGVLVPGTVRRGTEVTVTGTPPQQPEALTLTTGEPSTEPEGAIEPSAGLVLAELTELDPVPPAPASLMPGFALTAVRTFLTQVGGTPAATAPNLRTNR